MTSRTFLNLTLTLILAGLIALVIYESNKEALPAASLFTALDPEQIQQLRLQVPGRTDIAFTKIDGQWKMLTPFSVAANQERINALLKITQAKSIAAYPMAQVDTHQLQLDNPTLIFMLDDVILRFGNTEALSGSRYVQQGKVLHLITDRYSHLARAAATELVMPTLMPNSESVTALHLPTLELRLTEGRWRVEGEDVQSNPDHIQQLLDEWRYARALNVQVLNSQQPATAQVRITTQSGIIEFGLMQAKDELILQRQDVGLQYHFPLSTAQSLLHLPASPPGTH